jgi:hypothetical protein
VKFLKKYRKLGLYAKKEMVHWCFCLTLLHPKLSVENCQAVKIVLDFYSLVLYQRNKCFLKVILEFLDNKITLIEAMNVIVSNDN